MPKIKEEETCKLLVHKVPTKLKRKFKARCAENGATLRDTIIGLMKKFSQ